MNHALGRLQQICEEPCGDAMDVYIEDGFDGATCMRCWQGNA